MNIKIGEYVRTRNCKNLASLIGKVTSIDDDMLHLDCFEQCQVILFEDIKSRSKDLIDLIEVGDIVNGKRAYHIDKKFVYVERDNENSYGRFGQNQIKSILTHEQYEQNCYKVEE